MVYTYTIQEQSDELDVVYFSPLSPDGFWICKPDHSAKVYLRRKEVRVDRLVSGRRGVLLEQDWKRGRLWSTAGGVGKGGIGKEGVRCQ